MKKNVLITMISILMLFTSTEALLAQTAVQYYVEVNRQESGPFDISVIEQMIKSNRLTANTLVWTDGMGDWAAANSIAALQPLFAAANTAPLDDGWRPQPDTVPADVELTQSDTASPDDGWRPVINTAPRYYVILGGAAAGPYLYAELQEMVNLGQITETTQALTEGQTDWTDMQYIATLKPLFSGDYTYQAAQDKKFYIGARFGAIFNAYEAEGDTKKIYDAGLGTAWTIFPALSFSYNFTSLLALQIEGVYTIDKAIAQNDTQKVTLDSQSIVMPVLLKFMGRPSIFVLGGFVGGYVAIPLTASTVSEKAGKRTEIGGKVTSVPLGIIAGIEAGFQVGPNDFFIDVRYMRDLSATKFTANTDNSNDDIELFKASSVLLSIGYRVGF